MAKGSKELKGTNIKKIDKQDLPKAKLNAENLKKSLKLFHYLGHQKWKFTLGMIFLGLSAGVGLYFPMVAGKLLGIFGDNVTPIEVLKADLREIGLTLLLLLVAQGAF